MSARHRSAPHDSRRYMDWLERAHADLSVMRLIVEHGGDPALAVFHGHQTMEKSFKAYLLYAARQHADGHNLTWLCRQAIKLDESFSPFLSICARMSHYYIEARYPTDLPLKLDDHQTGEVMTAAGKLYHKITVLISG